MHNNPHDQKHEETSLEQLRVMRDRIPLEVNLAGKELRDDWHNLQHRFPAVSATMNDLATATSASLEKLTQELRGFYSRLTQTRRAKGQHVDAYMAIAPITCRPDEHLDVVTGRMWNADIGCLPVVDAHQHVVGMVTDRDACMASYTQGKALTGISVEHAMAHKVVACRIGDTVESVLELMKKHQLKRVPVLDAQDNLVGIVSLADFACAAADRKHKGLDKDAVADTLAAVFAPRQAGIELQPSRSS